MKVSMGKQKLGLNMMKAKRMSPMEMLGGHGVSDLSGFHAMLKKAEELEAARVGTNTDAK